MSAAKAIMAGLIALLAALGTALTDDRVTAAEWVGAVTAALVGFTSVYFTPWKPKIEPTPAVDG